MRNAKASVVCVVLLAAIAASCGTDSSPVAGAGKTPEGTLRAYFYYKDRGDTKNLRLLVTQNSLPMLASGNTRRIVGGTGVPPVVLGVLVGAQR